MRWLRRAAVIGKRTLVSFYDDQMTQHAGALTYYSLMSLFPSRRGTWPRAGGRARR
jgi:uncharacterized BrkB/YihY/UPF0761 family membrane protein